jgi:pyruvate formate lyase activating enzyme
MAEIEKDIVFYRHSGGGVTLSGGEPTMQPEFSRAILKACKNQGIHTAMETCADTDAKILMSILKHLDLLYIDIKHMTPSTHCDLTGKENLRILKTIKDVAENANGMPVIIRIPVIPGINDSDDNMVNTAEFVRRMKAIKKIELLPYHKLGLADYIALSRGYHRADLQPPSDAHLLHLKALIEKHGITAQINGLK